MSRVITFSRSYPAYHPLKGQKTYFVEKIVKGLPEVIELHPAMFTGKYGYDCNTYQTVTPKYYTIRLGNNWSVGDKFSPRVWSGIARKSKQIAICGDLEVRHTWPITIDLKKRTIYVHTTLWNYSTGWYMGADRIELLAKDDGLTVEGFWAWFAKRGVVQVNAQIICWHEKYKLTPELL